MSARICPFLVALLALTWPGPRVAGEVAENPPSLDDLLKVYKEFGLPMPPKEAKLVHCESADPGIVVINEEVQPRTKEFFLAFLIKPGNKKEHPWLLEGTRLWQPDWEPHAREVVPAPAAAKWWQRAACALT